MQMPLLRYWTPYMNLLYMKKLILQIVIIHLLVIAAFGASESHTYILVHGAWHGNWTYYLLKYELEKAGHTAICVNLPGHGLDTTPPGNVTLDDYANAIIEVLDTLDEPVVLVGHSMGGIAISMAAEARPEKIDKLVYLAAFMPKNGESMLDLALQDTFSMIGPSLVFDFTNNVVDIKRENIAALFYDSSTAEYVLLSEMLITPNPLQPLVTPLCLTEENYGSVRRFYITTAYDRAITPEFQEIMFTEQPCEDVYTMNSEHSPFFSAPDNLKNILDKIGDDDIVIAAKSITTDISPKSNTCDIKVYVSDLYTIRVETNKEIQNCEAKIFSLDGKCITTKKLSPHSNKFEIYQRYQGISVGILQLNMDGQTISREIIFEK